ncbi:vWA domain-containing protein [Solirubrobacter soli]|uniref:vWA domain-containing protein n=1 Tax=Solirubrobacter soli TaxID=363832 RepID=UPI00042709A2|nr:VWA-like domain-containing protein [Solirubrobacter soli]
MQVAAARVWAAAKLPYLAGALFAAEVRADPGSGTIAITRGWRILADPDVAAELSVEQLGRLLIHLVGHGLRDHAGRAERLGIADRSRWNRCADAELNDDLEGCVPDVAPDFPEDLGCERGRFAEHYYEHATDGPRAWDCGPGADGRPGDDGGPLSGRQCELIRLSTAAEIQRGDAPAGWRRWAETVLPSKIDWRRVLAAEVRGAVAAVSGMVDYSYRRPSRRALPDVVLPTLHRPVPDVAIVCDTSGSMHDELLARALAEVENVLSRAGLRQRQVRVLSVDAAVHAVQRVSRATQIALAGGGGTDMGAGIEAAAALRPRPTVTIVLTDGYTPWPDRPPPGMRVVVGLLQQGWDPPGWARVVLIDD